MQRSWAGSWLCTFASHHSVYNFFLVLVCAPAFASTSTEAFAPSSYHGSPFLQTKKTVFSLPSSLYSRIRMTASSKSKQDKLKMSSSSATEHNFLSKGSSEDGPSDSTLPTMIVFDLDDCLWSPEMYTLHDTPSIPVQGDLTPSGHPDTGYTGVVGMKVPHGPTVKLFPGARRVMYELATDPKYNGILLGAASSSEEPTFSYACLEAIEILPGLTMRDMIQYDQIGRTGKLNPDKRTHFRLIHQDSKIPYKEMLFFDDCNWGDHCAIVTQAFGVVSQRTPSGMRYEEFIEGLDEYRKVAEDRMKYR